MGNRGGGLMDNIVERKNYFSPVSSCSPTRPSQYRGQRPPTYLLYSEGVLPSALVHESGYTVLEALQRLQGGGGGLGARPYH